MNFNQINNVHFIGIGGIGMSALARYFNSQGKNVSGYDKTETTLTKNLVKEGIQVYYTDKKQKILNSINKTDTIIIYTPAISGDFGELIALKENGFSIIKRAKALGLISTEFETFAVAGTHGKTTTGAILAHVLYQSKEKCNAFIGGITTNYNSNCIIDADAKRVVVEADEFDRSFLELKPNYAILTTTDSDHLDIYGNSDQMLESFNDFLHLINPTGKLFLHAAIDQSKFDLTKELFVNTYGFNDAADWKGSNFNYQNGRFYFDIEHDGKHFTDIEFGLPGKHNAENALAVFALTYSVGLTEQEIREAFKSFKGVKRRFDFHIRRDDLVIIDDYAHHPTEITAFLSSIREIYPRKKITTIFQPHLFSRTRDFMHDFAKALALTDELFLFDIYPARELPIDGITSQVLLELIDIEEKQLSSKESIITDLNKTTSTNKTINKEIILIVGAGDIDTCIQPIIKNYTKEK